MDFLIREKADLFNSIYSYEVKLEEEQSKQSVHEDDVQNCTKCHTGFGWVVRKVNRSINITMDVSSLFILVPLSTLPKDLLLFLFQSLASRYNTEVCYFLQCEVRSI